LIFFGLVFLVVQENLRKEFPTAIGKEIPALKGNKLNPEIFANSESSLHYLNTLNIVQYQEELFTHFMFLGRKFNENCQFCLRDGTCKRQKFMNQFCHVSQKEF